MSRPSRAGPAAASDMATDTRQRPSPYLPTLSFKGASSKFRAPALRRDCGRIGARRVGLSWGVAGSWPPALLRGRVAVCTHGECARDAGGRRALALRGPFDVRASSRRKRVRPLCDRESCAACSRSPPAGAATTTASALRHARCARRARPTLLRALLSPGARGRRSREREDREGEPPRGAAHNANHASGAPSRAGASNTWLPPRRIVA
jgi:hypothetical protein